MRLLLISIIGGVTIASSALAQSGPQGADSTRAGRCMSAGCQRGSLRQSEAAQVSGPLSDKLPLPCASECNRRSSQSRLE
jgi:hypothetical protein